MMTGSSASASAAAICVLAAIFEGVCAGTNVRSFFSSLRFPRYSAPLLVWSIIGAVYYVIFGFLLYRLLRTESGVHLRTTAFLLLIFMLWANALTNYVIFRARNLRLGFVIGALFPILDVALFLCFLRIDPTAALALVPYLIYRGYAVWWGHAVWRLNPDARYSARTGRL